MKKLMRDDYIKLRKMVFRGARPLEYAKWRCLFEGGERDEVISVLSCYQNGDGGFGYELECNCWNPDSSPYVTDFAISQMDGIEYSFTDAGHPVLTGILKYLASGEYMTETGWLGLDCAPSNNDYSHMPWFHYYHRESWEVDKDITYRLASFILKYADSGGELYKKAAALKALHEPAVKAEIPDFSGFDPEDPSSWRPWLPMPVTYVGSPDSGRYPPLKELVDKQLDAMVERLRNTKSFMILTDGELAEWEAHNPHPDGKRWTDREQTIGNYYWGADSVIRDIVILGKFGRLDFQLPLDVK